MATSPNQNLLGQALRQFREHSGKSVPQIALEIGVNRGYLWLLESTPADWLERTSTGASQAHQPARDLIIRIAFALALTIDQADELLLLAGYAPLFPLPRRRM